MKKIPIEISARHVHLTQKDAEALFGKTYSFRPVRDLSQRKQFVTNGRVILKTAKGTLTARVLGPHREHTQVELSKTDAVALGLRPPLSGSGDFRGALDIAAQGPAGERVLKKCVMLQRRHLHCSPKDAKELRLRDQQFISIQVAGERALTLDRIRVRVHPDFVLAVHLDTDEGNAGGVISGRTFGTLCKNENK